MQAQAIIRHVRFLKSADTGGLDPDSCWTWTGSLNSNGYGRFVDKNKHVLAHRMSYMLFVGEIPDGLNVCHSCDNRLCVNPHHLWLGTQSENLKDAFSKGRNVPPDTRGERNGNRKLAAEDVSRIRQMHQAGVRNFRIAETFGISPSTVGNIINGETWKGVGEC